MVYPMEMDTMVHIEREGYRPRSMADCETMAREERKNSTLRCDREVGEVRLSIDRLWAGRLAGRVVRR